MNVEFATFASQHIEPGWRRYWKSDQPNPIEKLLDLFPIVESEPDLEDVVAVGDILTPEVLITAYHHGIFPWPHQGFPMLWFSPAERGVLFFDKIKINRSLRRAIKETQNRWRYSINEDFPAVIEACKLQPRTGQAGTWITDEMTKAYLDLHKMGFAHSAEVWEGTELIAGVYGVEVSGVFSGESMFFRRDNSSKLALIFLCSQLSLRGQKFIDIEMVTSATATLGGEYLSRQKYYKLLRSAQVKF